MPDFRVDDLQHAKEESRRAGLAAMGLWTMAGSYVMSPAVLSDGWVPAYWVASWPQGRRLAKTLVDAELWRPSKRDGQEGWQFVDWGGQRTAASVIADRDAARARMRELRNGRRSPERSGEHKPNRPPNSTRTDGERSDDVQRLPHPHPRGHLGGVSPVGRYTRAGTESPTRPPARCPDHADLDGDPGPCRACGTARQAAERWDQEQARRAAEQRSSEARQRAEDRTRAIAACSMCDSDGYVGRALCDHDPGAAERAARGVAAARAALNGRVP